MSLTAPPRPIPPPRGTRSARRAPVLLVALTVGAVLAIAYVLVAAPGLAAPTTDPAAAPAARPVAGPSAADRPAADRPAEHPAAGRPAAAPLATRGVVVASASCTDPAARDLVEYRGADGVARTTPLDACGTQPGSIVALSVPDGSAVAQLAGTGTPATTPSDARSPMTERLAVTLGAVAALGTAGLLVAVGRERLSGRRAPRPT